MKTTYYKLKLIFALLLLHFTSTAQKEPVCVSASVGFYASYSGAGKIGPGLEIKASKKINSTSLISLGLGFIHLFPTEKPLSGYDQTTRLVPVLIGYRKYWNKFYLEPRAGIGELGGKFPFEGDFSKPSVLAFMFTIGTGYSFRKFDIGMEVHGGAVGIDSPAAGFWYNKRQYYSALKIGIPLSKIK